MGIEILLMMTKTLTKSNWINTEIATGDLKDEITKLKSQEGGGDIIVYGVSYLILP